MSTPLNDHDVSRFCEVLQKRVDEYCHEHRDFTDRQRWEMVIYMVKQLHWEIQELRERVSEQPI